MIEIEKKYTYVYAFNCNSPSFSLLFDYYREGYSIKNHTHTLELSSVLPFVFLAGM
jgi:hypothetical protein